MSEMTPWSQQALEVWIIPFSLLLEPVVHRNRLSHRDMF